MHLLSNSLNSCVRLIDPFKEFIANSSSKIWCSTVSISIHNNLFLVTLGQEVRWFYLLLIMITNWGKRCVSCPKLTKYKDEYTKKHMLGISFSNMGDKKSSVSNIYVFTVLFHKKLRVPIFKCRKKVKRGGGQRKIIFIFLFF